MALLRLTLIVLLAFCCCCKAQECNNQIVCQRARQFAEDVCGAHDGVDGISIAGRRGKMGPRGIKGDRGESAVVDYERIIEKVEERYSPVINEMAAKYGETMTMVKMLNNSLETLKDENMRQQQEIEKLTNGLRKTDETLRKMNQGFCKIYFKRKCFWTVFEGGTYEQAQAICMRTPGGHPAAVYGEDHYRLIQEHVRSTMAESEEMKHFWLGMKINPRTKQVVATPGDAPASFTTWSHGYPYRGSTHTGLVLRVKKDPSSTYQGMYNNHPSADHSNRGVLCEA